MVQHPSLTRPRPGAQFAELKLGEHIMPVRRGNKLVTFVFLGQLGRLGTKFSDRDDLNRAEKTPSDFLLPNPG